MSVIIKWRRVFEQELKAPEKSFVLDDRKTWKGKLVRGHDIAEMIADEIWSASRYELDVIEITEPALYRGLYELTARYEPTFSAKKVDN